MVFPRDSELKPKNMLDIRDPVSRVSLDTFYQVSFSFSANADIWFKQSVSGSKRTDGFDFKQKMSLLCTQAEIPGTSYLTTQAVGHHQGIQEVFPTLRQFPPLNLTFYVDADHLILEVLENWMTYINPLSSKRKLNSYGRLNYPETYKERIHVSKFERDTFLEGTNSAGNPRATTKASQYEFVNVWPQNLQSMRISYGQSSILRCTIQLAYDRFFTDFTNLQSTVPVNIPDNAVNANDNQGENVEKDDFSNLSGYEHMPIDYPGNPNADFQFGGIQF